MAAAPTPRPHAVPRMVARLHSWSAATALDRARPRACPRCRCFWCNPCATSRSGSCHRSSCVSSRPDNASVHPDWGGIATTGSGDSPRRPLRLRWLFHCCVGGVDEETRLASIPPAVAPRPGDARRSAALPMSPIDALSLARPGWTPGQHEVNSTSGNSAVYPKRNWPDLAGQAK